jgi:hypothetical protein
MIGSPQFQTTKSSQLMLTPIQPQFNQCVILHQSAIYSDPKNRSNICELRVHQQWYSFSYLWSMQIYGDTSDV